MALLERLFGAQRRPSNHPGARAPRILVASLSPGFDGPQTADAAAYRQRLEATSEAVFGSVEQLIAALGEGFTVVHLFCDVGPDGRIAGSAVGGTELIAACADAGVRLLWIAAGNPPEGYIKDFKPQGRRINLVMTIDRKGEAFDPFLRGLLARMTAGAAMPVAWNALAPQVPHQAVDLPAAIFAAGDGAMRLG